MFERLTEDARWAVRRAQEHARAVGALAVESEHLLVALSERDGTPAQQTLTDAGLTTGRLLELITAERERSLRFAGIAPTPIASAPTSESLKLATSAKNVLRRAVAGSAQGKSRGIDSRRLLRAILDQEAGTVPRLLALANLDRSALITDLGRERL